MFKEPINLKLAGLMRVMQIKEHPIDCQCGNHEAHNVPFGVIKEAIASVKLDGDTMCCEKCPLGKDYRKQIIEEIEKHRKIFKNPEGLCFYLNDSWWQQFRDKEK